MVSTMEKEKEGSLIAKDQHFMCGDWQLNRSLAACTSQLLTNSYLSDVTFLLTSSNPPEKIPAHKFLLAIRSPVFELMFYGSFPERGEILIPDVSRSGFVTLLSFLYTDRAEITPKDAMECLGLAHLYQVPLLVDLCCNVLENNITAENACSILQKSTLYGLTKLQNLCNSFIDDNASSVLKADGFLTLSSKVISYILMSPTLEVPEIDIYRALSKWTIHQCDLEKLPQTHDNRRKFLGDTMFHIRLANIPIVCFAKEVAFDGLLSPDEVNKVFCHHFAPEKYPLEFVESGQSRVKFYEVSRFDGTVHLHPRKMTRSETMRFKLSKNARLNGLGFLNVLVCSDSGVDVSGNHHLIAIKITDLGIGSSSSDSDDESHELRHSRGQTGSSNIKTSFHDIKSEETDRFKVMFDLACSLKAEHWYSVNITMFTTNDRLHNIKAYKHCMGNSVKRCRVVPVKGIRVWFDGSSAGPICSILVS